jgi:hypothetical protein
LANAQDERFTPFWLSRSKGMTVDIWDYNPGASRRKSLAGVNIMNNLSDNSIEENAKYGCHFCLVAPLWLSNV